MSCLSALLYSSNAAAIHSFLPHLCYPTSLTGSHHNDRQLACKHHHRLEHVCPDHSLEAALKRNTRCAHITTEQVIGIPVIRTPD